jgi:aryl-alcohol dehydrogenase-like predicted oxidoreductase
MGEFTRREWITLTLGASAALAFSRGDLLAQGKLITRPVPSSGEQLPVVGLGSSATFSQVARSEDVAALREVMRVLIDGGATVFDTAPSYGASEEVAGRIATELKITERVFWATKVNAAGRGGGATPDGVRAQLETSFTRLGKKKLDLVQVHNLADMAVHLPVLKEMKAAGRIRYIGVTTTSEGQYPALMEVMRTQPLDFIGVDYAVDNREVEATVLPLARDRKIGVLAYVPFGRTRLFKRVGDRPVPDWAAEFDAKTWAQFFVKYVISHPAISVVTPATSQAKNMIDNMGGGIGKLPDEKTRVKMAAYIDALPMAS